MRFNSSRPNPLLLIIGLALILRLAAALILGNEVSGYSGAHDEISYSMLGQRFASGYGMTFPRPWYPWIEADAPQSYYSFTISIFLAGIYALFGYTPLAARIVMAGMSVLIILMVYLIAKRLFNQHVALLASAIGAVYAYLIFYGVTLVTETPFTLVLMVAIYLSLDLYAGKVSLWRWGALGVALAVAILLRMAVVFFIPILLIWLFWGIPRPRPWARLALPIGIIILALIPFVIRNYLLWGQFALLETQFGHVFWNGNHPGHQGDYHPTFVFPIPDEVLASMNDVIITNTLLRMGIQNVLSDPDHFALLTFGRLREFFTFWPTWDSSFAANLLRVFSFGMILPFALAGMILNMGRFRELAPIYLFILVHTGVYAITWAMIRYRTPMDPFLIMFAADSLWRLYGWLRSRATALPEASIAQSEL